MYDHSKYILDNIKVDESKLKVGDWVRDNKNKSCHIFCMDELSINHKVDDFDTRFKLWKPTEGEMVFYEISETEFTLLVYTPDEWLQEFVSKTKFYPLEFAMTLKDKQ
jgi:hypothetical protein